MSQSSMREDFVTIIAPTLAEVMQSYHAQGLAAQNYVIIHRPGNHSFTYVGEATTCLFGGASMVAATFMRQIPA